MSEKYPNLSKKQADIVENVFQRLLEGSELDTILEDFYHKDDLALVQDVYKWFKPS